MSFHLILIYYQTTCVIFHSTLKSTSNGKGELACSLDPGTSIDLVRASRHPHRANYLWSKGNGKVLRSFSKFPKPNNLFIPLYVFILRSHDNHLPHLHLNLQNSTKYQLIHKYKKNRGVLMLPFTHRNPLHTLGFHSLVLLCLVASHLRAIGVPL